MKLLFWFVRISGPRALLLLVFLFILVLFRFCNPSWKVRRNLYTKWSRFEYILENIMVYTMIFVLFKVYLWSLSRFTIRVAASVSEKSKNTQPCNTRASHSNSHSREFFQSHGSLIDFFVLISCSKNWCQSFLLVFLKVLCKNTTAFWVRALHSECDFRMRRMRSPHSIWGPHSERNFRMQLIFALFYLSNLIQFWLSLTTRRCLSMHASFTLNTKPTLLFPPSLVSQKSQTKPQWQQSSSPALRLARQSNNSTAQW